MHCQSCVVLIKETLEETDGVDRADVTLNPGSATVEFDIQKVLPTTLVEKIKGLGYEASSSLASES